MIVGRDEGHASSVEMPWPRARAKGLGAPSARSPPPPVLSNPRFRQPFTTVSPRCGHGPATNIDEKTPSAGSTGLRWLSASRQREGFPERASSAS